MSADAAKMEGKSDAGSRKARPVKKADEAKAEKAGAVGSAPIGGDALGAG